MVSSQWSRWRPRTSGRCAPGSSRREPGYAPESAASLGVSARSAAGCTPVIRVLRDPAAACLGWKSQSENVGQPFVYVPGPTGRRRHCGRRRVKRATCFVSCDSMGALGTGRMIAPLRTNPTAGVVEALRRHTRIPDVPARKISRGRTNWGEFIAYLDSVRSGSTPELEKAIQECLTLNHRAVYSL